MHQTTELPADWTLEQLEDHDRELLCHIEVIQLQLRDPLRRQEQFANNAQAYDAWRHQANKALVIKQQQRRAVRAQIKRARRDLLTERRLHGEDHPVQRALRALHTLGSPDDPAIQDLTQDLRDHLDALAARAPVGRFYGGMELGA